jgi:hypothetical protein
MQTITKDEYINFLILRNELHDLIIRKTTVLSFIMYNRAPKGDCIEDTFDFDRLNEQDRLLVQFVSCTCGEQDYDNFYLPIEFLIDESYPEKYKIIYAEEQRKKEEQKIKEKERIENNIKEGHERFERKEYERLKLKYEK